MVWILGPDFIARRFFHELDVAGGEVIDTSMNIKE